MKKGRYILCGGQIYHALGGFHDAIYGSDDIEVIRTICKYLVDNRVIEWWNIFDTEEFKVVEYSDNHCYSNGWNAIDKAEMKQQYAAKNEESNDDLLDMAIGMMIEWRRPASKEPMPNAPTEKDVEYAINIMRRLNE